MPNVRRILSRSSFGLDPVVRDWAARLNASSITPSDVQVAASNVLVKTLKKTPVWNKMLVINTLLNLGNIVSTTIPLLVGPSAWQNGPTGTNPYVNADLTNDGLLGNGNKFLNVGCTPATLWSSAASVGFSEYVFSYVSNSNWSEMGCTGGGNILQFFSGIASGNMEYDCLNNGNDVVATTSPQIGGFYSGSRVSATDSRVFFGNSTNTFAQKGTTNTNTQTGTLTGLVNIWAMGTNNSGPLFNTGRRISFMAWHQGLSLDETNILFSAVQTFRTSVGGGSV